MVRWREKQEATEPQADLADAQPKGAKDPRLGRTWDRVLEAYGEISGGEAADRALKAVFKRSRDLGGTERAYVSESVYALIRNQRTIDDILDRALKAVGKKRDLLDLPMLLRLRMLTQLALNGASIDDLIARDAYAAKRITGMFERIISGRLPAAKRTPVEEIAISRSLPDWFVTRLYDRLGYERTDAIGAALSTRAPFTLRVNTLVATRDEVLLAIARDHRIAATPTRDSPFGVILEEHVDVSSWELFLRGAIEVQDEGSQLLALATGAAPKEVVLDACAGAGGKTLALAEMMQGSGRLIALEPDAKKLDELKRRARRANITNVEAIEGDLQALPERLIGIFDRVLVDAPCTGSGAWRRHPDARWRVTEQNLLSQTSRQKRFIAGAAAALKPGGLLVYATCSVLCEENEDVIDALLAEDRRLESAPLSSTLGDIGIRLGASDRVRIGPGPSDHGPDGFFVASLRRV